MFELLDERLVAGLGSRAAYYSDSRACLVVVQRGWSRAEYRVVADDSGSNVEFVLLDISRSQRERGRFTGARMIETAPALFERMLRELRLRLE
ncbi:hypothetical protein [Homoserinimonas hongtaonis]|uniref:Uncharacterized protein n=1 Tax=Homoserinimonas hongtaonis TaxID=2079791 RepID=A0A2U1SX32_9MICO|nr:hypothetical protein [Salinibacterium hongtaonis]PWB96194.1 hypothetical protein DF220_12555 [Salinibacterium hongtaonis]